MMLHEAVMLEFYRQALSASMDPQQQQQLLLQQQQLQQQQQSSPPSQQLQQQQQQQQQLLLPPGRMLNRYMSEHHQNSSRLNMNIYELASPRCQSRESSGSGGGRCQSDDSNCSGNGSTTAPLTSSPVGITLPATLAPSAAAALLPPQSAAMAAYLNVAAAAAQQNRLLLSNPLAAAANLVHQVAQSPPNLPLQSPLHPDDSSILDFSTKRMRRDSDTDSKSDSDAVNLSKSDHQNMSGNTTLLLSDNSPLDLSVGGRKRNSDHELLPQMSRKMPRIKSDYKSIPSSPWVTPMSPYLAAVAAASLSPKNHLPIDWNNSKTKLATNDATKALEKMSEMTRLGGGGGGGSGGVNNTDNDNIPIRPLNNSNNNSSNNNSSNNNNNSSSNSGGGNNNNSTGTGRHSAWQSHWLNKGADAAKDVFKCVWCKQSFPTLATLTTHMKETQHCGVNVPPSNNLSTQQNNNSSGGGGGNSSAGTSGTGGQQSHQHQQQQHQHHHHHHHQSPSSTSSSNASSNKSDLNLLIKETMPLPRKLVRGQDVWLGKGAEQTRQILKCMWCGQSFRSLAEMTSHMQQTQHYTNIISQEQIISWKSSEDGKNSSNSSNNNNNNTNTSNNNNNSNTNTSNSSTTNTNSNTNSTVSAVLTCKVCDQAFSSLKDLSNHMVKNAHYKEHIMRSITESGGRRRQTREKRKKSLPVRKLLELERAQHDFKNGDLKSFRNSIGGNVGGIGGGIGITNDLIGATRITCEKCGDKIETALFVEHIRQCVGGTLLTNSSRNNFMKTPLLSSISNSNNNNNNNSILLNESGTMNSPLTPNSRDGRKSSIGDESTSPASNRHHISPHAPDLVSPTSSKDGNILNNNSNNNNNNGEKSSPSVLNAIEQLIEKSFDTRSRHNNSNNQSGYSSANNNNHNTSAPLGSSILKRLGIDESVDYTKPLIDTQTMNLLRSYHQNSQYSKRERSGSESSSVSDRGSSRLESLTPERKPDLLLNHQQTLSPRQTPDKLSNYSHQSEHDDDKDSIQVKREPIENDDNDNDDNNNNNNEDSSDDIHDTELRNDKIHQQQHSKIKKEHQHQQQHQHQHHLIDNIKETESGELDLSAKRKSNNTPISNSSIAPSSPHLFPMIGGGSSSITTPAASPVGSDRSITPRPRSTTNSLHNDKKLASGSLNALSSMFNNLTGTSSNSITNNTDNDNSNLNQSSNNNINNNNNGNGNGNGKKGSSHPLAALQKLCDKTENHPPQTRSGSTGALATNIIPSTGNTASGNILAFSWACNDAVMTSDSIIKCAFCDTPFCSKGAYRHHLSKVHFVKDDAIDHAAASSMKSPSDRAPSAENNRAGSSSSSSSSSHHHHQTKQQQQQQQQHQRPHSRSQSPAGRTSIGNNNNGSSSSASSSSTSSQMIASNSGLTKSPSPSQHSSATGGGNGNGNGLNLSGNQQSQPPPPAQSPFDESPHSKFLKYTELAKQLSSKYV